MSEYWVSQAKKFCNFCKCWLSDNKASIEFHESGRRHQGNVEQRLKEIGKKGAQDERKAKKEEEWIQKMELAAMNDYRCKDLAGGNPDLTANIFHEKRALRDTEAEQAETTQKQRDERAEIASKAAKALAARGANKDPMLVGMPEPRQIEENEEDDDESPALKLRKMDAPKSGTKWHNEPKAKEWFEAKTEDGNTYFWHVESHESRWEPPPEGYLSIKEQEDINKKHEHRELKKYNKIATAQALHSKNSTLVESSAGPAPKADPYGGWKSVVAKPMPTQVDYQAVEAEQFEPTVTLHDDRMRTFETKKTPSLKNIDSFEPDLDAGIITKDSKKDSNNKAVQEPAKPAIVFRKRKINPEHRKVARRQGDDD